MKYLWQRLIEDKFLVGSELFPAQTIETNKFEFNFLLRGLICSTSAANKSTRAFIGLLQSE